MRQRRTLVWGVCVLLGGCSIGPNYHKPATNAPAGWAENSPGVTTNAPVNLAEWWKTLADEKLNSLVQRAISSNLDLQAVGARVRAARALKGAAAAEFIPTIDATGGYTVARRSQNALAFPVRLLDTETWQAGFDASWELDVFGGKRRAYQAASADLQAVEEERRGVVVSLLGEVARNYVDFRGTQRRLAIARENLQAQQQTLEISQLRFEKGLTSELDVAQARALLATTRSQVPTLETALKASSHRLSVLLGLPPGSIETEIAAEAPVPVPPTEIPAGLPSDLLLRRPDVRRSERQLAAATARIGVAQAELFPKFFLTGTAGFQSLSADNLISPGSKFWTAGPSVRWRLLEYPRLRAQIKAQNALQEQALAEFHQVVLLSLEEVENALVAFGKEKERHASLLESVTANRRSLELANELYAKGLGDFLNVLVSERALYESQDALVQSERDLTQNLVALYKALGGGWETTLSSK